MAKPAAAGGAAAPEKKGKKKTFKRKSASTFPTDVVHIQASFNNTIVTISDRAATSCRGRVQARSASADRARALHSPPSRLPSNAANMARDHGVRSVEVRVSGPGSGRESAIRALAAAGIEVRSIKDSRRFRTTAAVRRSAVECKNVPSARIRWSDATGYSSH